MAGTGHAYEITNIHAVHDFLREYVDLAVTRGLYEAQKWLCSRHVLKFVTSEKFTQSASMSSLMLLDAEASARIRPGKIYKTFSAEGFHAFGPDLGHLVDWMEYLSHASPKEYDKVARMSVDVVVKKAAAWTKNLAARMDVANGEGEDFVFKTEDGLTWVRLSTPTALDREGAAMSHCVGTIGYASRVQKGTSQIYSLRRSGGKRILTVEIACSTVEDRLVKSLVQAQCRANGGLPPVFAAHLAELLNFLEVSETSNYYRRYHLKFDGIKWSSAFADWRAEHQHGCDILTDGKGVLILGEYAKGVPVLHIDTDKDQWILNSAGDGVPHHRDQKLVCHYLNTANPASKYNRPKYRDPREPNWLVPQMDDNGPSIVFSPRIDTMMKMQAGDILYFAEPAVSHEKGYYPDIKAFHLPHSHDPARILVSFNWDKATEQYWPTLTDGAELTEFQIRRCLAVMDIVFPERGYPSKFEPSFEEFLKKWDISRRDDAWRSFVLDHVSEPDAGGGSWKIAPYKLVYERQQEKLGRVFREFHIRNGKVIGTYSCWTTADDEKACIRFLNKGLYRSGDVFALDYNPSQKTSMLWCPNGRWQLTSGASAFASKAREVISRWKASPKTVDSSLLGSMIKLSRFYGSFKTRVKDLDVIHRDLLGFWIATTRDFSEYPASTGVLSFGNLFEKSYSLADRLMDLYRLGFVPTTKAETTGISKVLHRCHTILKGAILQNSLAPLIVAWSKHATKPMLNTRTAYVSFSDFSKLAAPDRIPDIIATFLRDDRIPACRFKDSVARSADSYLSDCDFSAMNPSEFETHVNLLMSLFGTRSYYFHCDKVFETVVSLLNALPEGQMVADVMVNDVLHSLEKHLDPKKKRREAEKNADWGLSLTPL